MATIPRPHNQNDDGSRPKIALKPEDFGEWDRNEPILAGNDIMRELHDIVYHAYNEGEGWTPFCDETDTPAVIAEVRGYIERVETVLKKARRDLAAVVGTARLAAYRRIKAEEAGR